MKFPALAAGCSLLLVSCEVLDETSANKIPGPAKAVTRHQAIAIAQAYTRTNWTAEERHRFHGSDSEKILVHTPDAGSRSRSGPLGYWNVGETNSGVPYKWGGFDTPRSFKMGLAEGKYAGDIPTRYKRKNLERAVSKEAVGIDCSGLISRAWRLERAYSTRELPEICDELDSFEELDTGDILNVRNKHVVLFSHWVNHGKSFFAYEAAAAPEWRVVGSTFNASFIKRAGYVPLRYKHIRENDRPMYVNGRPYRSPFLYDPVISKPSPAPREEQADEITPPEPAPAIAAATEEDPKPKAPSSPASAATAEPAGATLTSRAPRKPLAASRARRIIRLKR